LRRKAGLLGWQSLESPEKMVRLQTGALDLIGCAQHPGFDATNQDEDDSRAKP
jgi:hypothetical protein